MMRWTAAAILIAGVSTATAAECDYERAVWADSTGLDRIIVYFSEPGWSPHVRFERWSGQELVWTLDGRITCSNGVVICFLSVPLSDGESVEAPVEEVGSGDGPADYMVFAQLAQSAYRAQAYSIDPPSLDVKWSNAIQPDHQPIKLPSAYRFLGCRDLP